MKVLLVHNFYQQRGGEDTVVESELALLRRRGHEVACMFRHNDEASAMPRLVLAAQTIWSQKAAVATREAIERFHPNVIHVHNAFPLISPAVYWSAAAAKVPVVQTLHNFRLCCPQAMLLRDGRVCEDCLGKVPWRGVVRACYRQSHVQSGVLAGMLVVHRALSTFRSRVTRFIALNDFCRRKFIEGGLPPEKLVIKPNFVVDPGPQCSGREGFLFVGRLSPEKGIAVLADAFDRLDGRLSLRIVGIGPESAMIKGRPEIKDLGPLPGERVMQEMASAQALVMPSICYESFPRTLVEAFACGLPVIASRLGAMGELIEDGKTGLLFEAGNANDLATKLRWAQDNPLALTEMGRNARLEYEAKYTPERNYAQLMAIYEDAITAARKEPARA